MGYIALGSLIGRFVLLLGTGVGPLGMLLYELCDGFDVGFVALKLS